MGVAGRWYCLRQMAEFFLARGADEERETRVGGRDEDGGQGCVQIRGVPQLNASQRQISIAV